MPSQDPPPEERSRRTDTPLSDAPVSRRKFARLAAATGGALSLPTAAAASDAAADTGATDRGRSAPAEAMTDRYGFIVDHVSAGTAVSTLVWFAGEDGFAKLDDAGVEAITTTAPRPAAYAEIDPETARTVAGWDVTERMGFSPGAAPFWRLGHYPNRIFPTPDDATGYLWFEEVRAGLDRLADERPDRLRVQRIGESPGYRNEYEDRDDPRDVLVVEVAENVADRAAFAEKEKVIVSLGIHGDERVGVEAGTRLIEQAVTGDDEVTDLLGEVALLFVYPNPDGWVSRSPVYGGDGRFTRTTGAGVDPNRQYPTVGWIDPAHYPAEPAGRDLTDDQRDVDDDVVAAYDRTVPGMLSLVEHFRGYENLEYGTDLHGMFGSEHLVEGLIVNDGYDHEELHDLYELNRRMKARLESSVGDRIEDETVREAMADHPAARLGVPSDAYEYGTILDTIGYTTTGTLISWMSQPESEGGLGVTMMGHEMALDNAVRERMDYRPTLLSVQVDAYQGVIRELAAHAVRSVEAVIETGGTRTAYVNADLASDDEELDVRRITDRSSVVVRLGVGDRSDTTLSVDPADDLLSLTVATVGDPILVLRDPSGRIVRVTGPGLGRPAPGGDWVVPDPAAGDWTVTALDEEIRASGLVRAVTIASESGPVDTPDPRDVLGYAQREYAVDPLQYFEDYGAAMDGDIAALSPGEIADGALGDVDALAVAHDRGTGRSEYVVALDEFVTGGGRLLLTDDAVALLGALPSVEVGEDAITELTLLSGVLGDKRDHPLLDRVRPIQRELYNPGPLGYRITRDGSAPITTVDRDAFEAAGGTVAATAGFFAPRGVGIGVLPVGGGEIAVCCGAVPIHEQGNLHPFGLLDYTTTMLGHTVIANALGHEQIRQVDGERVDWGG